MNKHEKIRDTDNERKKRNGSFLNTFSTQSNSNVNSTCRINLHYGRAYNFNCFVKLFCPFSSQFFPKNHRLFLELWIINIHDAVFVSGRNPSSGCDCDTKQSCAFGWDLPRYALRISVLNIYLTSARETRSRRKLTLALRCSFSQWVNQDGYCLQVCSGKTTLGFSAELCKGRAIVSVFIR